MSAQKKGIAKTKKSDVTTALSPILMQFVTEYMKNHGLDDVPTTIACIINAYLRDTAKEATNAQTPVNASPPKKNSFQKSIGIQNEGDYNNNSFIHTPSVVLHVNEVHIHIGGNKDEN